MKAKSLYIIDVMGQVYRAFYGIRHLSDSENLPTNAIFGFAGIINKLLKTHSPDYIVATTDVAAPTHRHEAYADYKATRRPMPEDLQIQIPYIYELCRAFNLPLLSMEGYEADDIISTLAKRAASENFEIFIVSRDKDLFQLVGDAVYMLDLQDEHLYDRRKVMEKLGVTPEQVADYLSLTGDSSDNIPGAPGIGPKTAVKLIEEFQSLDNCYAALDRVTPPRIRNILDQHRDKVFESRRLVTLSDVPLQWDWDDFRRREPDKDQLQKLYTRLEFKTLLRELQSRDGSHSSGATVLADVQKLRSFIAQRPETPVALHFAGRRHLCILPENHNEAFLLNVKEDHGVLEYILRGSHPKRCYRTKHVYYDFVDNHIPFDGVEDVKLMHYLLRPHMEDHSLERIALDVAGISLPSPDDKAGSGNDLFSGIHEDTEVCSRQTAVIHQAVREYAPQLEQAGLEKIYREMELPLVPVLIRMERNGILLDIDYLFELSAELQNKIAELECRIYELAGEEFNINSPKQLGHILFEKLQLPASKRTKRTKSYSTGVEVLEELALDFELPALILDYRLFAKLKSTYVDALPRLVAPETGRIHTTFHQTVAATGRLSSANPNLQNIPIRTDEGKKIRKAFVAPAGYWLVSADYSQIELRIMAHLSADERLIAAFHTEMDIHRKTAIDVFGPLAEAKPGDFRHKAKAINYGILYGQSDFGLARELKIPRKEAQHIIDSYFATYPGVQQWILDNLDQASKNGLVRTLFGRIRPMPELSHSNWNVRKAGERMATNAPVQGSAADIIKIAMLKLQHNLDKSNLRARLLLQVHDELILECPEDEVAPLSELLRESMENVAELSVPLTVDIHKGKNWLEAK